MNRDELEQLIMENYGADPDYPWVKYPDYEVFRHAGNRKWFVLIATVPKNKLGIESNETIDIANFKCDSLLSGVLRNKPGFFPAYHMNKEHWITAALDGSASDDDIIMALDTSYELTFNKRYF